MTKAQKVQLAFTDSMNNRTPFLENLAKHGLAIVDVSEPEIPEHLKKDDFLEAWASFLEMRESRRKKATTKAKKLILKKLEPHNLKTAIKMLEQSEELGWTTVYPLRGGQDSFEDIKERWKK